MEHSEYELDLVTPEQVQVAVDAAIQEVKLALERVPNDQLIQVRPSKSGLDPATTAIIVAFSPLAAKIARDIWDNLILPRIRRDNGQNSIRPVPDKPQ